MHVTSHARPGLARQVDKAAVISRMMSIAIFHVIITHKHTVHVHCRMLNFSKVHVYPTTLIYYNGFVFLHFNAILAIMEKDNENSPF